MTDYRDHFIQSALKWTGRGIHYSLRSYPLAWSLTSLVAGLTAGVLVLGGVRIQAADSGAVSSQHVESLVNLASAATNLGGSMEDEADLVAVYVAQGRPDSHVALLLPQAQMQITNQDVSAFKAAARRIGAGYPAQVRTALATALYEMQELSVIREDAEDTQAPALDIVQVYTDAVSDLLALDNQIATVSGDATLSGDVRALSALAMAEDDAAQQRAILDAALNAGQFQAGEQPALSAASREEQAYLWVYDSNASAAQQRLYQNTVSGQDVDNAAQMLQEALISGPDRTLNVPNPPDAPFASAQISWQEDMTFTLDQMRAVERSLLAAISAHSQALHTQATQAILDTWLEMMAALLAVVAFATVLTRRRSRSSGARGFHPAAG
jgi:Nitrate and nitrite sensing